MESSGMEREKMVELQLLPRGITDENILLAMRKIPREKFIPAGALPLAYTDQPLPIGANQTISQPYIVAYMCQELHMTRDSRVLEIGTGSGYETAVLALCAKEIFTVEFRAALSEQARSNLLPLRLANVNFRVGDGHEGWPQQAPFDAIIVSACFRTIPPALISQLKVGGRLVAPVGTKSNQNLILIEKFSEGIQETNLMPVAFVRAAGGEDG